MTTLSITSDYLQRLILKVRGLQAREEDVDVDVGSTASYPLGQPLVGEHWAEAAHLLGVDVTA